MATNEQLKLPRGIRVFEEQGRPRPYACQWRDEGKRRTKFYDKVADRDRFAKSLAGDLKDIGVAAFRLDETEARTWRSFKAQIEPSSLDDVLQCWARYGPKSKTTLNVGSAIERFLANRLKQGLSRDSISHVRLHLTRFGSSFGSRSLGAIASDELRVWLSGLKNPETGAAFEPYTIRHHILTLKLFFKTAVAERWTTDDPAAALKPPATEVEEVSVLSLDDARKLFKANAGQLCIGRLALEAFGGLRYTSAGRLKLADIVAAERGIVMPGKQHKSGKRHFVDGYPSNLWAWIASAPAACWDIHPRQYLDLKATAFARSGIKNPGNVLRHSFCTYHVAMHKDAARTAVLLTHRSPSVLYQHYRGRGTAKDGRAYFRIMPPK